ncbi:MAG: type II secretion system protein GspL, partial [Rhodoferax sp.]
MRTLILTLPTSLPGAATPVGAVLSADGSSVSRQIEVPLALLPDSGEAEVVALVPLGQMSWHRLELPRGTLDKKMFSEANGARLRSVLEGLLEEVLLDEPEQLHFALAPDARAEAPVWVAVCDRAWLHAWLAALELAGRPALRIVPELAPAGAAPSATLHFTGTAAQPEVVCSSFAGLCRLPWGAAAAQLLAPEAAQAQVYAEPALAELAEQQFEGRVSLQTAAQRALAAARSDWDLAQFDCSASRAARSRKRISGWFNGLLQEPRWRAARWALGALLLVQLVGLLGWNWKEQAALANKRAAIQSVLTSTFLDVKLVVDAPLQMARGVADLRRQTGTVTGTDLESMLLQYTTMSDNVPPPKALDY